MKEMLLVLLAAVALGTTTPPVNPTLWAKEDSCGICTVNAQIFLADGDFVNNAFAAIWCEDTNDTYPFDVVNGNPVQPAHEEGNIGFLFAAELAPNKTFKRVFGGTYTLKSESK